MQQKKSQVKSCEHGLGAGGVMALWLLWLTGQGNLGRLSNKKGCCYLLGFLFFCLLCVVIYFANSIAQNTAAMNTCSCHYLLLSQGCSPWLELHKQPGRIQVCYQVMANHFEWQNVLLLKDLRCNGQRSNMNNFIILGTGIKITEASLLSLKKRLRGFDESAFVT